MVEDFPNHNFISRCSFKPHILTKLEDLREHYAQIVAAFFSILLLCPRFAVGLIFAVTDLLKDISIRLDMDV